MDQFDFEFMKYKYGKENLSIIFDQELDLFPSVKTNKPSGQRINLWELFQKIRYNLKDEITPTVLITNKYLHGEKNEQYSKIKGTLPAICYNATFKGTKSNKNIEKITNLMFLEIDDLESKVDAEEYKQELIKKHKWIVACYRSLSGLGLHLVIAVDHIEDSEDYKWKYHYVSEHYFNSQLDSNANKLTQYTILPYDFDIYINENPTILPLNKEYQEYQKSASTGNKKERIITTTCTFSSGDLNHAMNVAARDQGLRFEEEHQMEWNDPNKPIFISEGKDVIEVNLYLLFNSKVFEGNRNNTIGKLSMKLIFLNPQKKFHDDILKFVVKMNYMICSPPLAYKEVVNSFEANWEKHLAGKLDIKYCLSKRRFFWSPVCTLNGKEKRTLAARIFGNNRKEISKQKIYDAIEDLSYTGVKIKQKDVIVSSGLSPRTVKNYWSEFKSFVKGYNDNLKKSANTDNICEVLHFTDTVYVDDVICKPIADKYEKGRGCVKYSEKEMTEIFNRIYSKFIPNLDKEQTQELKNRFLSSYWDLPKTDQKYLSFNLEDIQDSDVFWRLSSLYSQFWSLAENLFER